MTPLRHTPTDRVERVGVLHTGPRLLSGETRNQRSTYIFTPTTIIIPIRLLIYSNGYITRILSRPVNTLSSIMVVEYTSSVRIHTLDTQRHINMSCGHHMLPLLYSRTAPARETLNTLPYTNILTHVFAHTHTRVCTQHTCRLRTRKTCTRSCK